MGVVKLAFLYNMWTAPN